MIDNIDLVVKNCENLLQQRSRTLDRLIRDDIFKKFPKVKKYYKNRKPRLAKKYLQKHSSNPGVKQ